MIAVPFQMRHLAPIAEWLAARKLPLAMMDDIPEIGFVVEHEGAAVCMGFLRQVEGDHTAIFDSIISNPEAPAPTRNAALDILYAHVLEEAKARKLYRIIGFTTDNFTLIRSLKHGFLEVPHALLALDLSNTAE